MNIYKLSGNVQNINNIILHVKINSVIVSVF